MERKENTAVIIGRFQVPYLHLGHIHLISHALQNYESLIILLGILPDSGKDHRNPYTYEHRRNMIYHVFNEKRIKTFTLEDIPGDDETWSKRLDAFLKHCKEPVLLHSRDSFKDHYVGKYPLREIPELPGYSGAQLRQEVKDGILLQKPD